VTDIVITGRGVVSSIGESPDAFFEALLAKRSGIADGIGACVDFDPEVAMSPKEARRSDRYTQLAVAAAMQAAEEAGLRVPTGESPEGDPPLVGVDPERLGVLVGTGVGGLATLQNECQAWLEGGDRAVSPHFVPMMMPNAAAGTIAMRLGAHGPGFSVSSACATGGHAIGVAARMIARGEVDAVVAGGTEAALTGLCIAAFKRMGALSREGLSRPFDVERDGFVMGEGAGILVLEAADKAAERGAKVLGTLKGYGASADAYHLTAPDKTGGGPARAMAAALKDAGITPEDVVYVNAHGTSTALNDSAETVALKTALGDHAYKIPVSSLKSSIGHTLGAAGAVEAVATILALRDRIAPPTLGLENPGEGLDLDYVPGSAKPLNLNGRPAIAISSSFGFGGHNAVLCLEAA
jgi:3-oxoacyl-[acyl-carrier-protein] synthase II